MRGAKKGAVCVVLVLTLLISSFTANVWATDLERENSCAGKMVNKLGRGVMNILFGWMEIPYNIAETWKKTDPFTGFIVGGIKGIFWGWARTMTGLFDVFTFPFPVPKDYEPLMEPENILPEIWGEPFPHYAD